MDCPGGDIVIVDQSGNIRERKQSRGGEASDSSSKDGSIQSDTSLDSEDSCVSVIFVPHPDGKFGLTGEPVADLIKGSIPRKQSNSSESSESTQSGKTSPILSPGMRLQASPTKTGIPGKTLTKIELFRQSVGAFETHAIVSRNVGEDVISCSETVYCLTDRTLEKIDERHTESESEAEKDQIVPPSLIIQSANVDEEIKEEQVKEEVQGNNTIPFVLEPITEILEPITENEPKELQEQEIPKEKVVDVKPEGQENSKESEVPPVKFLQRRLSSQKSYEAEDMLDKQPQTSPDKSRPAVKRRLKSSKERQRAKKPLPPKLKYDYPIVRHHPLFAKQGKPGEKSNNFSSLLMGKNVRIIRGQSLSSNDSFDDRFDLFNPELDDSDSDNDGPSISSGEENSSSESSSCDSNNSVESVVSASKASVSLKEEISPCPSVKEDISPCPSAKEDISPCPSAKEDISPSPSAKEISPSVPVKEDVSNPDEREDTFEEIPFEISKRAEKRRESLMSLLDENQSVIGIIGRRRQLSLSASSSASSLKLLGSTKSLDQESPLLAAQRASGAIPKKPLPAIVEPHDNQPNQKPIERERRKIGKAKSVTSDTAVIKDKVIIRQSSVPVTSEKTCFPLKSPVKIPGSPILTTGKKLPVSDPSGSRHLSPRGPSPSTSETSGIQAKGSHESLAESTGSDSGGCHLSGRKSISPVSPSRSDTGEPSNVSTGNVTKKQQPPQQLVSSNTLPKKLSHVLKTREGSLEADQSQLPSSKQDSFDLPTLDEESTGSGGSGGPGSNPINPVVQRRPLRKQIVGRDDSIESNAKYSDTSSLLSHRFSTISISSNVSSDMSISASGGQSGSSCYLASMSSTDFDDRPILASSISLSEAEIEPATPATAVEVGGVANTASAMFGATSSGQPGNRKVKLKAAYKRPLLQHQRTESSTLPSTTEEESGSPRTTLDGGPTAAFARSRIGTETSLETSIENPTCIQGY